MNKTFLFLLGLFLAAAIGTFLPQAMTGLVEGAPDETTYQFINLGLHSPEAREQVEEVLSNVIGISKVSIDPNTDQVTITFDQEIMKAEWISKTLDSQGFRPETFTLIKN
jgi:copper chaperone CopZ